MSFLTTRQEQLESNNMLQDALRNRGCTKFTNPDGDELPADVPLLRRKRDNT